MNRRPLPFGVDLWLADCRVTDARLLDRYRHLLPIDEQNGEWRLRFARDRRRYLVSRALVRTVLSRYAPTLAGDWRFASNAFGRPQVSNDGAVEQSICFNLSHTSDIVLLGVSGLDAVGVDIEAVRDGDFAGEIAERFFAAAEVAAFLRQPSDRRPDRFFEYWTLKESYIKAQGMGLSIPLDSFALDLDTAASIGFSVSGAQQADAPNWRFWQIQPVPDHLAAVCVYSPAGLAPVLSLYRTVPLVCEEPLDCPVIRRSAGIESP